MVELIEKVSFNVPYVVSVQFTRIGIVTASVKPPASTGTAMSADIDIQVRYVCVYIPICILVGCFKLPYIYIFVSFIYILYVVY